MKPDKIEELGRETRAAQENHNYYRLAELNRRLVEDYAGLKQALIEIENLTLVIDKPERLRAEVRSVATKAIEGYVLK